MITLKLFQVICIAVIFGLQYFFEHVYPQRKDLNSWKNERKNIAVGLMNLLLVSLPSAAFVILLQFIDSRNLGLLQQVAWPNLVAVVVCVLVLDLWMYAWHRLNHTVPWLWRFHRYHHTDDKMNSTTAIRFHFGELFFSFFGKAAVCLLLGITYPLLVTYELVFFASIVFHHSNIRISAKADAMYRRLFASPGMHRIHHSREPSEQRSNYGSVFSFWDSFFGTAKHRDFSAIVFGVEENR
jgi:sterol desaturase/sphingolipid hydroxylase (fatty acid hydroxylase superfamily)